MKNISSCFIFMLILAGCTSNLKGDYYVMEFANPGYKISYTSYPARVFYDFEMNYVGRIQVKKDNNIILNGPKKKRLDEIYDLYEKSNPRKIHPVKIHDAAEREVFLKANIPTEERRCYYPPFEYDCTITEYFPPGTEFFVGKFLAHIDRGVRVSSPLIFIDPVIGKKMAKGKINLSSHKDYKDILKYVQWKETDIVYYIDGEKKCLYKENTMEGFVPDDAPAKTTIDLAIEEDIPLCDFK